MKELTIEQAIIITGYTGVLSCDFLDFKKDVEKRLKRQITDLEMLTNKQIIKDLYFLDFLEILPKSEVV